MSPSRRERQRARQAAARELRPAPRVDVFGTLRAGEVEARVRLLEYAPLRLAAFSAADVENPLLFELEGELHIKGRVLTGQTQYGELRFQKAGCGCETPRELRVPRSQLLSHVPIATEELKQEAPDTVMDLHRELM